MGLLDSEAMKFIFSNTQYMKNKRQDEVAEQAQGLIGNPMVPGLSAPPGMEGMGASPMTGGSGLLGGQVTPQQFNAQMMGLPGMQKQGMMNQTAMLNNQNNQIGSMDRQMQQQGHDTNNMSMYQKGKLFIDQQKAKMMQMAGNNGMANSAFNQITKLQQNFDQEVKQYETSIIGAQDMDMQVEKSGGYENLTGADQQAMISGFLGTIRPGEAQMEGDIKNLAKAHGFKGEIKEFLTYLSSDKGKSAGLMKDLHALVQKKATMNQGRIDGVTKKMFKAYGLDEPQQQQITWGSSKPYVMPTHVQAGAKLPSTINRRGRGRHTRPNVTFGPDL